MADNKSIRRVQILDCTLRDGGYCNEWRFEKRFVREMYRQLSKAGVDFVEIGYRGTSRNFSPDKYGLWRFSTDSDIAETTGGIRGARLAVMGDYGKIALEDFRPAAESPVAMVRLAAHRDGLKETVRLLAGLKRMGYLTSLQAMGFSGFSKRQRKDFLSLLKGSGLDFAYVADTYGSIFPGQIEELISPLVTGQNEVKIGFHPHNSLQMAFANSIEAIRCGAHILDGSVFGMGRGAGNLPTEIMLAYLHERRPDKFNVIPVLNLIDKFFISMQKELGWGYQLPYMLSGLFRCHPTYARRLVDFREFTMEDIWRFLECVKRRNPGGFSESVLSEIISQGISRRTPEPAPAPAAGKNVSPRIPYLGRHKGRTFLVLGNGPTLKQYKPQIDEFIRKYDPVVMGANYLGGLFAPMYHAFCNKRRFIEYIDAVDRSSSLLVSQHIPVAMAREYTKRSYERIYYRDTSDNPFGISRGVIDCNCRTVSVLLMGLAAVMGAERVFAVGMDGYMNIDRNGNLFYKETEEKEDPAIIADMHSRNSSYIGQINRWFLDRGKEGIHILTPTSYGEYYKGIKNYI